MEGFQKKRALIVVDYQNDFVDGSLGFPKAVALEEIICRKIEEYQNQGDAVIFTFDCHDEGYLNTLEGKNLPVAHCIFGTKGYDLFGKVARYFTAGSVFFNKPTFGSLELANYLQKQQYQAVELVGLVSNICVVSNAILAKAALPEAQIIVDAQATASFNSDLHAKVLEVLAGVQIQVIPAPK